MFVHPSLTFELWAIDFVVPFPKPGHRKRLKYIITSVEYVTKWVESCTKEVETKFIYENIITRFGCLITLINDSDTHFINQTIDTLMKEFMIDHHKSLAYHA